jgi:hypothetical protein
MQAQHFYIRYYSVPHLQNWMRKREVAKLLEFIYEWLYPEGFSEVPKENAAYRAYLSRLCRTEMQGYQPELLC